MTSEVAIAPFQAWLTEQLELHAREDGNPTERLARILMPDRTPDAAIRKLNYWRNGQRASSQDGVKGSFQTDTVPLLDVVEALHNAGTTLAAIYPEHDDITLEAEGFCERCHEIVTPIAGACPWCDTAVLDSFDRAKDYCPACDRMLHPANDQSCWRCGGKMHRGAPQEPCECGCGTMKRRFDPQGRPCRYIRGHAPRSLERDLGDLEAEPFALFLEERLRTMDLLGALARECGIPRQLVADVLNRRDSTVSRASIRRALWICARGNGRGSANRPGVPGLFDLYPDDGRARRCPSCGEGKSPAAVMCKACRKKQPGNPRPPKAMRRIRDDQLAAAYAMYKDNNSYLTVAEHFINEVRYSTVASLGQALRKAFQEKGWPTRRRTPPRDRQAA